MPREGGASSTPRRPSSITIVPAYWIARLPRAIAHKAGDDSQKYFERFVPRKTGMTDIRVPTLGESVTEATIGRWFKKAGDAVAVDEPLVELETDKVTIEVPAPSAGVLGEIAAKDGETVAVGALLGQINEGAAGAKPAAAPAKAAAAPPPAAAPAS